MRRSSVFTLSHYPKPCGLIEDGLADKQALNSTDDLRKYYGDLKMENEGKKKKKKTYSRQDSPQSHSHLYFMVAK